MNRINQNVRQWTKVTAAAPTPSRWKRWHCVRTLTKHQLVGGNITTRIAPNRKTRAAHLEFFEAAGWGEARIPLRVADDAGVDGPHDCCRGEVSGNLGHERFEWHGS